MRRERDKQRLIQKTKKKYEEGQRIDARPFTAAGMGKGKHGTWGERWDNEITKQSFQ